jgi:hypothetical protein
MERMVRSCHSHLPTPPPASPADARPQEHALASANASAACTLDGRIAAAETAKMTAAALPPRRAKPTLFGASMYAATAWPTVTAARRKAAPASSLCCCRPSLVNAVGSLHAGVPLCVCVCVCVCVRVAINKQCDHCRHNFLLGPSSSLPLPLPLAL